MAGFRTHSVATLLVAASGLSGCSSSAGSKLDKGGAPSSDAGDSPGGASDSAEAGGDGGAGGSGGDGSGAGDAPAGCVATRWEPGGVYNVELTHDGQPRSYLVHVGDSVDVTSPTPLALNFHGLGSNAVQERAYSLMGSTANARGLIVAYPEGIGNAFNAGPCCAQWAEVPHAADDVGFARAVVADVAKKVCVDSRRTYSTGLSNGGYMSEHLACHAADLFAAVAPVSAMGALQLGCEPARAVPLIAFNGTEDSRVSYDVSVLSIERWVERNGCEGEPDRTAYGDAYCDRWSQCQDGAEVVLCTIPGMEHCWPGNTFKIPGFCEQGGGTDILAHEMMWDFFSKFQLPE